MDNFAEQLVVREPLSSDKTKKILTYAGGIVLTILFVVFSFLLIGTIWMMVGLLIALGTGYGTYYLGKDFEIEYEYTFTNGEMDIDKIIAKSKRKELITIDIRKVTDIGRYDDNAPDETDDMTVVFSSDNIASHEYYMDFPHEEYGNTRVVFSPDERMLSAMKMSLSPRIRNKIQ